MLVDRWTFSAKDGRVNEMVELIKAEIKRFPPPHASRIYVWPIGPPRNRVIVEFERENLAEYERGWAEWLADAEAARFLEKLGELEEAGTTVEIWTLAE